jgi:uncharacterized protein (TIGR02391 family)
MASSLRVFEQIARGAHRFSEEDPVETSRHHPFDVRGIHPKLPPRTKELFDDGYYAEATFEAFKFIDRTIASYAHLKQSGFKLMMAAFDEANPVLKLNALEGVSEIDEQKGFRFLFAGGSLAIRNPRAHEHSFREDPDTCLDYLAFASLLLRRLESAGYV